MLAAPLSRRVISLPTIAGAPAAASAAKLPTPVMATAMQKAKSADPARYLPELKKIRYEGVTGTSQFDPAGDILNGALTLYTYKGGERTRMDVFR